MINFSLKVKILQVVMELSFSSYLLVVIFLKCVIDLTLGSLYDFIYISDMMADFLSAFSSNLEKKFLV